MRAHVSPRIPRAFVTPPAFFQEVSPTTAYIKSLFATTSITSTRRIPPKNKEKPHEDVMAKTEQLEKTQNWNYVIRSGLAGGFAGCMVR